jgi:hypothetical protein
MAGKRSRVLHDNAESGRLRLALLKENFQYRDFFEANRGRMQIAYRAIREANRRKLSWGPPEVPWVDRDGNVVSTGTRKELQGWFHSRLREDFGIERPPFYFDAAAAGPLLSAEDALSVLDPKGNLDVIPEAVLSRMFHSPAIWQIRRDLSSPTEISNMDLSTLDRRGNPGPVVRRKGDPPPDPPLSGLRPFERLLLVDLRRKRADLLAEFAATLDSVEEYRKKTGEPEWIESYSTWKPDTTRSRIETRRNLKIYRLWREGEPFTKISKKLNISLEMTKGGFYRVFEQIQNRPYNPGNDRPKRKIILRGEVNPCPSCPSYSSCVRVCHAANLYANQESNFSSLDLTRMAFRRKMPRTMDKTMKRPPAP